MLDAEADRERLRFHEDAAFIKHCERVTRAVARREHDVIGVQRLALGMRGIRHRDTADRTGFDHHVDDTLLEANFAAERLDLRAHFLDHADETEGADVRLGDIQDFLWRPGLHELRQHLARQVARIADLAPQLAVGKGSRTAFAELHIRLRIQHPLAPQPPGVLGAFAHALATLEHDRPQAHLRQHQRGEDAARTEADDDRPRPPAGIEVRRRMSDETIGRVRRRLHVRVTLARGQHGGFVAHVAVHRVSEHHSALATGIHRPPEHAERTQIGVGHAQPRNNSRPQCGLGMVKREPEFGEANHLRGRGASRYCRLRLSPGLPCHRLPPPPHSAAGRPRSPRATSQQRPSAWPMRPRIAGGSSGPSRGRRNADAVCWSPKRAWRHRRRDGRRVERPFAGARVRRPGVRHGRRPGRLLRVPGSAPVRPARRKCTARS